MKKTLVALAALSAISAFAQSSVTIDGYFDRGYTNTNSNKSAKDAKGISSSAGTTTVGIKGVEDLGNGLKVGFSVNTDWAEAGGLTQDGSSAGNTPTAGGSFGNSQSYIELVSANAGKIQFGNINNEMLGAATGVSAPAFSTGLGSSYSSSWSILNGYGTGTTDKQNQVTAVTNDNESAGARGIRQVGTIKYTTPTYAGFNGVYGRALQNDQTGGTANTVGVTDASLNYANGPLTVVYALLKYDVGATAPANGSLTASTTNTHKLLGASYQVLPALKLHAGTGSSTSSNGTLADSTFKQFGATYTYGQFDFLAQTAKVDDKLAANIDRKMTGLGVNYNLSKTARVYFRQDRLDRDTAHAHLDTKNTQLTRTAVGISKAF